MVKKALCVGCNYPSKAFGLAGAVNDAFLIADCLQKNCGFEPENVCVLHDIHPGQKKSMKVDPAKKPTRVNILQRLQWLVRNARPGDVLFFSFSGYGLQVDDMDGYQDEGYDEAILPTDFVDGRDGDYTVIVTDDIHDCLMGVPPNCGVTVVMDCDHATSVVDVSGTLDGGLVNGLKYQNFCGLKVHTAKVQLAAHNREVWQEERARTVKARPRFQPMMEIDNPRKGRLPTRPAMSRSSPVAFCYSAAAHGQTAMEMQINRVVDGQEQPRQHGILTWCWTQALEELRFDCTHTELLWAVKRHMQTLKEKELPRMDQEVLLTFSTPLSNPQTMKVLQVLPTMVGRGNSTPSGGSGQIAIVPPPPPGFIKGEGGTGDTGAAGGPPPSGPRSGVAGGPPPGPASGGHFPDGQPGGPPPGAGRIPSRGAPEAAGRVQSRCTSELAPQAGASRRDDSPPPPPPPPPKAQQQAPLSRSNNSRDDWANHAPPVDNYPGNPHEAYPHGAHANGSYPGPTLATLAPSQPNPAPAYAPAPNTAEESAGAALIPNFFNMPATLFGQRPSSVQVPPGPPAAQPGVRGFAPQLVPQASFQQQRMPPNAMSFSVPAGVGMPQTVPPGIPPGPVASFTVRPQMLPGRGYSFTGPPAAPTGSRR